MDDCDLITWAPVRVVLGSLLSSLPWTPATSASPGVGGSREFGSGFALAAASVWPGNSVPLLKCYWSLSLDLLGEKGLCPAGESVLAVCGV